MKRRRRQTLVAAGVFWMLLIGGPFPGTAVRAAQEEDRESGPLVGTWRVVVNEGTPGEFFALMVFNRDRTMTERNGEGASTTMSTGVWEKLPGSGRYATTFEGFWDINADGLFDRRFLVSITMQVVGGDAVMGTGTFDIISLDGQTHMAGPFPIGVQGARMTVISD